MTITPIHYFITSIQPINFRPLLSINIYMMRHFFLFLTIVLNIIYLGQSQAQSSFPEDGQVYIKSIVPRVDILIHPDSLAWIYENVESDHEFRAVFVFDNGNVHDTIRDIGFRLRGNTSRVSQKKSFKVSFNTFIPGRKYSGVEKMNLNGEHNDPTVVRARLYWDILRKSAIAGPRANHVQVFINGNYYGLYANIEHIDEEFVEKYFGNKEGNLYKCLWPADLTYRGNDPDLYKFLAGDRRTYELKTNEEQDDYSDIAHFIDVLNNTPIAQLPCAIESVFNVQDYLKIAAIDVLTANWDGYIYNKNNFYLYHNTANGLFEYIPYDTDNTFGIDWFNIDWASRNIYAWEHPDESRPLFTRLLQVPEYKAQYTYYMKQVINNITSQLDWMDDLIALRDQLRPYVEVDPYYPLDYGYDVQSFNTSFVSGTGAHVPIGLQPFVQTRNMVAISQADNANAAPMIRYLSSNSPAPMQPMEIKVFAEDENLASVELLYRINNSGWQELLMFDNGLNGDVLAGDGVFSIVLPGMGSGNSIDYQVKATGDDGISSTKPCDPIHYIIPQYNPMKLYINEFMASNSSTISDEYGDYDDWIEIYNGSSTNLWLGDKYLSDNLASPTKWAFPDTTIGAGGFLIVWADGEPEQGPMHTTYKLSKDYEEIGIYNNEASSYALIDSVSYTSQSTDVSMGRVIDGAFEWKFYALPTPGSSNSLLGVHEISHRELRVWPNPVVDGNLYLEKSANFRIVDLTGKMLLRCRNCAEVDVSGFKSGLYILILDDGGVAKVVIR